MAGAIRPAIRRNDNVAKVTMPQLGESVAEGTIGKWLKQPGDTVAKYEPLLEVITDKVNAEVPSPFAGVLREILVEEGATVPNNAEIAVIETADEGGAPVAAEKQAAPSQPDTGGSKVEVPPPAGSSNGPAGSDERRTDEIPDRAAAAAGAKAPSATGPTVGVAAGGAPAIEAAAAATAAGNADARMTPAVRRLLREHGLAPAQIAGTGGGGRITREDVTNYVESQRTGTVVNGQSATP